MDITLIPWQIELVIGNNVWNKEQIGTGARYGVSEEHLSLLNLMLIMSWLFWGMTDMHLMHE